MNSIEFVGYDALHTSGFRYKVPPGFDSYLLIVTTTPVRLEEAPEVYPAHTAILYPPHTPVCYGSAGDTYGNHWVRFHSDEPFVTGFPSMMKPFTISDPDYIRNLFQLLTWETAGRVVTIGSGKKPNVTGDPGAPDDSGVINHEPARIQSDYISDLLRILFGKLRQDLDSSRFTRYDHLLLNLRRRIIAHPEHQWNIKSIAEELHISSGYFQMIYKQQFSVSCMEDVIQHRLIMAKDRLSCSNLSVAEIAEQCGYMNTEHFCRQFRQYVGTTPGNYRKNN